MYNNKLNQTHLTQTDDAPHLNVRFLIKARWIVFCPFIGFPVQHGCKVVWHVLYYYSQFIWIATFSPPHRLTMRWTPHTASLLQGNCCFGFFNSSSYCWSKQCKSRCWTAVEMGHLGTWIGGHNGDGLGLDLEFFSLMSLWFYDLLGQQQQQEQLGELDVSSPWKRCSSRCSTLLCGTKLPNAVDNAVLLLATALLLCLLPEPCISQKGEWKEEIVERKPRMRSSGIPSCCWHAVDTAPDLQPWESHANCFKDRGPAKPQEARQRQRTMPGFRQSTAHPQDALLWK